MSEMSQGMASEPVVNTAPKRCLVVDATPSVQAWVDDFYSRGCDSVPGVPDGTVVVTVAAVWRAVEKAFSTEDDAWTVANGWPNLSQVHHIEDPSSGKSPVRPWYCALFGWGC